MLPSKRLRGLNVSQVGACLDACHHANSKATDAGPQRSIGSGSMVNGSTMHALLAVRPTGLTLQHTLLITDQATPRQSSSIGG